MAGRKKRTSNRMPVFLLTLFAMLMQFTFVQGQNPAVVLHLDGSGDNTIALHRFPWFYHSGDDTFWAKPGLDDSHWDKVNILFGDNNLPKAWNGMGWFRIWIRKDNLSAASTWGLRINHDAASEIYWDGEKIAAFGRVGHSRSTMQAERAPFLAIPIAVTDTLPHLLAIRFSNYNGYFSNFIGLQAWIGVMKHMNRQLSENKDRNDSLLLSVAVQLTLILIHLFLFLFYPRQKLNLYFSLFVLANAIALYAKYLYTGTSVPAIQVAVDQLFFCDTVAITFTGGVLLYGVGYSRLPVRRIILLSLLSLIFICAIVILGENASLVQNGTLWISNNVFFCLIFIDGLWSVSKGIRQRKPGIWIIAIGMFITGLLSVIAGSDVFGWLHGNYQDIIGLMALVTLIMPVCFSIYLAMDFARINKDLAQQLKANQILAARNLIQEQEKTRLITEQAEKLEVTVLERTEQLRLQADKLRELDSVKSRFFVNLTHEFKTPLTLIINPAKELLRQSNSDAAKLYTNFILESSERLLTLTNQLLDLSRLENGQMEINLEKVELISWLRTHLEKYGPLTTQRQLTLDFSSDAEQLCLEMDLDKLEKILQNLISNAIKFIPDKGAIKLSLKSGEDNDKPWFELIVQDNGAGIPADRLPFIFDRFYQADLSDTRSKEGTGIGLALAKELTELLGGVIGVNSSVRKETKFFVRLPYKRTEGGPIVNENSVTGQEIVPLTLPADQVLALAGDHLPLILIVEDNENLRRFMSLSLSGGYRIILAGDGMEGLASAFENIPDLVITDVMMPGMDGYHVCTRLKADLRTSHIPVIMLTAKTDQDSRVRGLETGADAYLAKPFDKRELLILIVNLIRVRQQLRDRYGKNNVWLTDPAVLPPIEKTFLDLVRQAIEQHIDDAGYSADQLGRDTGFSRTQLHRKLKELIGQSPGELIRAVRMQRAYELLQQKVATVAEVSYMVGYANPANFSTSFSRYFGFPPSKVHERSS